MQELEKILKEIEKLKEMYEESAFSLIDEGSLPCEYDDSDIESAKIQALSEAITIILKHMNDGWISVEERLPEDEAKEFIDEKFKGFGYLYPCLTTYKNPVTGRIYTAKFYYDIYEKWFVNLGEVLLPKDNVLAWRPLPSPYRPERSKE